MKAIVWKEDHKNAHKGLTMANDTYLKVTLSLELTASWKHKTVQGAGHAALTFSSMPNLISWSSLNASLGSCV